MYNTEIFASEEFGPVRTLVIENNPYFSGKDVAQILGYENQNRDIVRHVDEEDRIMIDGKTQYQNGIELGQRGGWVINESGLYSLILSSKMPKAKQFKHWVTSEVLPAIRKHGMYAVDELLNNPDAMITVLTQYKAERDERIRLEAVAKEQEQHLLEVKPKEIFADAVTASDTAILVRDLAKLLRQNGVQTGEKRLYKWMREHGYIFQNSTQPTQRAMEMGLFEIQEISIQRADGNPIVRSTTKVTGKGQMYFINKLMGGDAS